jgi:hypothetical protein
LLLEYRLHAIDEFNLWGQLFQTFDFDGLLLLSDLHLVGPRIELGCKSSASASGPRPEWFADHYGSGPSVHQLRPRCTGASTTRWARARSERTRELHCYRQPHLPDSVSRLRRPPLSTYIRKRLMRLNWQRRETLLSQSQATRPGPTNLQVKNYR